MSRPIRTALRSAIFFFAAVVVIAMMTGKYTAFSTVIGDWLTANVWPTLFAVSQAVANWLLAAFVGGHEKLPSDGHGSARWRS